MKENYCICGYLVSSDIERNEHILSHFKQKQCSSCDSQLIFVAGKWYQPHDDLNCNLIKKEPESGCLPLPDEDGDAMDIDSIIEIGNITITKEERSNEKNTQSTENSEASDDDHFADNAELEHKQEILDDPFPIFAEQGLEKSQSLYKCENCSKEFSHLSSFIRHNKWCLTSILNEQSFHRKKGIKILL